MDARLRSLARRWVSRACPSRVVSGMAAGWDMAVAAAAVEAGVPLVAAKAWDGQGEDWPEEARSLLRRLLASATLVHVHAPARTDGMWTARDRWVLAQGDAVVALWSGADGGTARAVRHAVSLGMDVENLWDEWTDETEGVTVPSVSLESPGRVLPPDFGAYAAARPGRHVVQDARLCTRGREVWHGDLDVERDYAALCEMSRSVGASLYMLPSEAVRRGEDGWIVVSAAVAKVTPVGVEYPAGR